MQTWVRLTPAPGFNELTSTSQHSRAATLVIAPNERSDVAGVRDAVVDRWFFVLAGEGRMAIADETASLGPGALILIEAGETSQIHNLGDVPLEMFIVYAPNDIQAE